MSEIQQWFYAVDEQTVGPVSTAEIIELIQQQVISGSAWLVAGGSDDWTLVRESSFRDFLLVPAPNTTVGTHDVSEYAESESKRAPSQTQSVSGSTERSRFRIGTILVILILFVGLSAIVVFKRNATSHTSTPAASSLARSSSSPTTAASMPLIPLQVPVGKLDFDRVLSNFFTWDRNSLPVDIQGFRFGSSVEDVCANYVKQYGQPLAPSAVATADFSILKARFEGEKTRWSDRIRQDRWEMEFGFYKARLVYINKVYRSSVDPAKISDLLKDYFMVTGSGDADFLGRHGFFQSDLYTGFLSWKSDSLADGFRAFDHEFLRRILDTHARIPFEEFCQAVQETDFTQSPKYGGGVHLGYKRFAAASQKPAELQLSPEQAAENGSDLLGPVGPYQYLYKNLFMCIAQTVFPPETGDIERGVMNRGNFSQDIGYQWDAKDKFFVILHDMHIEVGRKPDNPVPDKL